MGVGRTHSIGINLKETELTNSLVVDVDEAARLLGIGRTTLYKHLKSGSLTSIKIGGRRVIRRDDLPEWLARMAQETANDNGRPMGAAAA